MKTKAPDPQTFLAAAELIIDGREGFCCCALDKVTGVVAGIFNTTDHHTYFEALLRPAVSRHLSTDWPWYQCDNDGRMEFSAIWHGGRQEARAMGLILCAVLAREGFIPKGWRRIKTMELSK